MPKYEYACKSCGERLEVVQSFTDAPLAECPACGGPLRKVFSAPAITFKGSGFYRTDNRGRGPDHKADSSTETKADGKAEPAKGEPAKGEPAKGGPAKAEPAGTPAAESKPKPAEAKTA